MTSKSWNIELLSQRYNQTTRMSLFSHCHTLQTCRVASPRILPRESNETSVGIATSQKTLLASGITRDDLFYIACLSPRVTLSPLIVCSTLISKHVVMTTSIYLQSYKTASLFSTRNHYFCFNSESRLSQIFLLGR